MLCCVPKRPVDGGPFHDKALTELEILIDLYSEEDAPPSILLPCTICARTFMPQSLEKHARICERTVARKRRPFDSAKQRIQGTELAEFLPKVQETRRYQDERGSAVRPSWKKTHDDFLRAIREARGEVMDSHKQCNSLVPSGAPTRANEKGMCPTCNRHFGIRAYDRHVAWCKERITRLPVSPATNLAKERLEARIRYRAPVLKNRRATVREKYSPGSTVNHINKIPSSLLIKPKESVPALNCNREEPIKQKPAVVRRLGQLKQSPTSSGPMKSRPADRTNKPAEDHGTLPVTSCRSSHLTVSSRRPLHFPVPPLRAKIDDRFSSNEIALSSSSKKLSNQAGVIPQRVQNDEANNQEICSARTQRNIVSARSQGHPKLNDVAVNDKTLGVTVQPCKIHKEPQKEDQLITWKQISHNKSSVLINGSVVNRNFSHEFQLLDLNRRCTGEEEIDASKNRNIIEDLPITKNDSDQIDELKTGEFYKIDENDVTWLSSIQNLNKTYLIKDSEDIEYPEQLFHNKWKPIRHSPRVEFYFKDTKDAEICELDTKKSKRRLGANDEDIKVTEHKAGECKIDDKDNPKKKYNEIEVAEHKIEKLEIYCKNKEDDWKASEDKATLAEDRMEEIKLNSENKKDIYNDIDIVELDKLNVNKRNGEDGQVAMDACDDIIKQTEELNRVTYGQIKNPFESTTSNLSDSIKLPTYDIMHITVPDTSKEHEESYLKQLKIDFTDNNDLSLDKKSSHEQYKDITLDFNSGNDPSSGNIINQNKNYNLSPEDEISQCESNRCFNDSLNLKESATTFICDQCEKINSTFLKCSNDYDMSLETTALQHQDNLCHNSLDLEKNVKRSPSSISCRHALPESSIVKDGEKDQINEDRYEDDLITFRNEQSEKCMNELNSEMLLSMNSEVVTDNYLNTQTNKAILQTNADKQHQEDCFLIIDSNNSENNEGNFKNEKRDFITILGDDSDNKTEILTRSANKAKDIADERLREIREKSVSSDYDSDNIIVENNARDANKFKPSDTLKDSVGESRCCHETAFVKADINFTKRSSSSTRKAIREHPANCAEMKQKIRERMNFLRDSTDSLVSSVEFVELSSIKRPEIDRACSRETIEIIKPSKRSKLFRDLPDINDKMQETGEKPEKPVNQTYWERASKISQSRLINLNPSYRMGYRFVKRNPKFRILPPVPSSPLTNRSGTCKDYNPFLLAEQQMKDLLSDTSDQSVAGSPKPQIRDGLYPLSHSSAFVKYPCQSSPIDPDRRSSLIAPPSEFDDLASDLSSDSTETNSISREVFLKDLGGGKTTMDSSGPRPVRELGRRLIIDKTRALGGDLMEERRGVVGSADRSRNSPDKVVPKVTRPLVDRSNSIRASSAPKTNSSLDRRASGDAKVSPKLTESQRSSDRSLNQRNNNNYSSLSGSNLSLSSIVSSEMDIKRSNSMFDELMTSLEEDVAYPTLRSYLNNESFDVCSPMHGDRQRSGLVSDEELSSPDSYKPQDHSKLSIDSAYSSLNRKYSHHGRSTNDVVGRFDEDASRNGTSPQTTKCKMSKFCHECGQRFPENAKFCCECGIRRLAL